MADVTDKDREAAKSARYTLHGEESESVLDCETGIIVGAVDRASAELMRDQLNSYEERLASERAAHEATKAEVGRLMVALYGDGSSVPGVEDELTALKARLALAEATINTLQGYAEHGSKCVLSRWEAGRPTPDGGYEWKYAGMWYDADNLPACECDLGPALAAWRAAK